MLILIRRLVLFFKNDANIGDNKHKWIWAFGLYKV